MRKICVVTGSRAEYGLLSGLMKKIRDDHTLQLQSIATNMHLAPEFGNTYREIEADGFTIDKKVPMSITSDTASGIVKSMSEELSGMADAFDDLKPDLLLVLGDRYEILTAVSAALIYKIPVAHLYGGEITEGAYDNAIRHAITKMSHLHFTSTEEYRKRVIQMGENPQHVWHVGAIGVDNIKNETFLTKEELENSLNFKLTDKTLLVTYHPVTLENNSAGEQCRNLLQALEELSDYSVIFTQSNSDTDGRIITELMMEFVSQHKEQALFVPSLGKKRYLSALKYVKAVVGNSSSGIVEVPSFGIPTLNIGDRQKGRIKCDSIIDCDPSYEGIRSALSVALSDNFLHIAKSVCNPYEKSHTSELIYKVVKVVALDHLCSKKFYDL
jgi:UDP-hydrolysing UDP-N-acetyl-D-glucosamine 2-epimerase